MTSNDYGDIIRNKKIMSQNIKKMLTFWVTHLECLKQNFEHKNYIRKEENRYIDDW